jgi:hypothetical protein
MDAEDGDLLGAVCFARAPEPKKATLKAMLAQRVASVGRRERAQTSPLEQDSIKPRSRASSIRKASDAPV